jgi:DNA-binding MarR family transcriptional regulator
MSPGRSKLDKDAAPLSDSDFEGAVRVFQSLEKLVARPRLVDSLQPQSSQLVTLAKRIRATRAMRAQNLAPELFGEPGWDILLSLYVAYHEGYRMKMAAVCNESGVPDTTALRWLESLRELGLVTKKTNPLDARSQLIELTALAAGKMDKLLQLAWQEYFPFD